MRFIDLHVHTTASDGSFTPSEVCQMALDKGLAALAITDHDTVDGVPEAIRFMENHQPAPDTQDSLPMELIPGIVQLWFTRDPYSGLLYGLYQSRTSC